ncbi:MAG: hypothetical protein PVF93_11260, partial [Chromatiaceae bacterium]
RPVTTNAGAAKVALPGLLPLLFQEFGSPFGGHEIIDDAPAFVGEVSGNRSKRFDRLPRG